MTENREKQIEEMAKEIIDVWENKCQFAPCTGCKYNDLNDVHCQEKLIADHLISLGYCKQEWISVEERLPKKWEPVLVFCDDDVSCDFISLNGRWYEHSDHDSVTHWMPLPEPPKVKGGAE